MRIYEVSDKGGTLCMVRAETQAQAVRRAIEDHYGPVLARVAEQDALVAYVEAGERVLDAKREADHEP